MSRAQILSKVSQNLYETIRSLELAHQRTFDTKELKIIIENYYKPQSKL